MSKPERPAVTSTTSYNDLPDWLSVTEASTYLGCSQWLVRQGIDSGDIPARRIRNKYIRIPKRFFSHQNAMYSGPTARPFSPISACGHVDEDIR